MPTENHNQSFSRAFQNTLKEKKGEYCNEKQELVMSYEYAYYVIDRFIGTLHTQKMKA